MTIPIQHLTFLLTSLTKSPHFDHKCLLHTGKILPHPLHRYNSPLSFEHHVASAIDLGAARRSTTLQTLYSPPHLTRNVPGERPELSQPSSSNQTMARPESTRRSHGKVQWEGLMFLVQTRDLVGIPNMQCGSLRSPWVAEKVGYHPTYKLHSVHVRGRGASSRCMLTMLSWELRTMPKELRTSKETQGGLFRRLANTGSKRALRCSSSSCSSSSCSSSSGEDKTFMMRLLDTFVLVIIIYFF